MEYNFTDIEKRAKEKWAKENVYQVSNDSGKPKCYILDMFPYPSGAGLHVGHPLGYIASDIYARYKRLKGFNVLHPMGFDAFGLPAEQYAIETGQHPKVTTEKNIARYREQLDNIGFCYDWGREVRTSDPKYYKWTQWIFLQLFHSWYDHKENKAKPIKELVAIFEKEGNINVPCPGDEALKFDSATWRDTSEKDQRSHLMQYRLAYQGYAQVWWCEALGTVLANDEVVNGVSERGGHPVERKNMRQWFLRITEYAERLLQSLDTLDWSDAMKEMQRNWIGKSNGAEVVFEISNARDLSPTLSKGEGDVAQNFNKEGNEAQNATNTNQEPEKQGWNTADGAVYNSIKGFREDLKSNLTKAENILWQELRRNNLGVKFRRQHIVGKFIVDFICLPYDLIVEVDGKIHEQQKIEDALRTEYLEERGFKVIRFTNEQVITNVNAVVEKIKEHIAIANANDLNNARNLSLSPGEVPRTGTDNAGTDNTHNISLSLGEGRGEVPRTGTDNAGTDNTHNISLSLGEGRGEVPRTGTDNAGTDNTHNPSFSPGEGRGEVSRTGTDNTHNISLSLGEGRGEVSRTGTDNARTDNTHNISLSLGEGRGEVSRAGTDNAGTDNTHNISLSLGEGRGEVSHTGTDNAGTDNTRNTSLSLGEGRGEVSRTGTDNAGTDNTHNISLSPGEGRGEVSRTGTDNARTDNTHNISLSLGEGRGEVSRVEVFTTRPDTIFGVDFMVLAPEHELVDTITTPEQKEAIDNYKTYVKSRSERERMSEVKQVTGCFTGAYAIHPLTGRQIPIWISEYVLAGYGTGAIMGVPSGDERDHAFAKHFNIPITNIFGEKYTGEKACSDKTASIERSDFLSGMSVADAAEAAIGVLEDEGVGKSKINYKLRDAGFSRQRYWGEPFPIMYVDDIPYGIDEPIVHNDWHLGHLPVELPMVEHYKPGPEGEGPLANIEDWVTTEAGQRETNTMPGYAGSSWYFLRYMDPHNDAEFASRKATDYWNQVDLYIGGTEHAVGHLLYSRMWTKALCDLGHIGFDEPFKKLLNQGMIQGKSKFAHRLINFRITVDNIEKEGHVGPTFFFSLHRINKIQKNGFFDKTDVEDMNKLNFKYFKNSKILSVNEGQFQPIHVDINLVDDDKLNIEKVKNWKSDFDNAEFILEENGDFICSSEVEKMSKSKYNVVNPDDIVAQYGADTFRMYEMFLGPIDISKPWDTKGIEGVHRFLKKMWRLYADEQNGWIVNDETPTEAELRILHKTIKKIGEDIERFSFNTSVSQFMICVNELTTLGCHKRGILQPLAVAICPFAPHIAEELWQKLEHKTTVIDAPFPAYEERYVTENTKKYPVAVNGKTRVEMEFPLGADEATVKDAVLADETIQKWMEGKAVKKFIYVTGKMINVVV